MKCEEAAEFVSALCDGVRIPREAAEHLGACEECKARLNDYVQMGVELKRMAIATAPERVGEISWGPQERTKSSWWQKGSATMRIPRFAFALMLVVIVGLGASFAVVKARPGTLGRVLMMTIKTEDGEIMRCALSTEDEKSGGCAGVQGVKSGTLGSAFRITGKDRGRIELGVRSKFVARPSIADGKGYSMSVSTEDLENVPERRYWFEPGEKLEIEVAGFGTMAVSGELLDHMPAFVGEEMDPRVDELRVTSPLLLRGKEVVLDFEGGSGAGAGGDMAVFMYTPNQGRYVL